MTVRNYQLLFTITSVMNLLEQFKKITTLVFDMDGVLTDGTLLVFSGEQQLRTMNVKDGLGLQMAIKNGYRVVIISGGTSDACKERLVKLGVQDIYMSVTDKRDLVAKYLEKHSLSWEEVLYMADDLPDIDLLQAVAISSCPADAVTEIRSFAHYISPFKGGEGCVRDIIEKVLKVNDKWEFNTGIVSK